MFKKISLLLFVATLSQLSMATEEQSKIHLIEADKLWSESKYELAEAEFKKALAENPDSPKASTQYAGFLLTQNRTEESVEAYKKAIMLDAENPKSFAALSIAYLHQSKFEMAKAMADEALRLDPKMGAVKKINEYIDAKKEVIKQASKIPKDQLKPDDAMHTGVGHGSTVGAHGKPEAKTAVVKPKVEGTVNAGTTEK